MEVEDAQSIQDAIRKLANTYARDFVTLTECEVLEVDEDSRTCNVKTIDGDSELEIPNVLLMAEPNDGMLLIPAIGSIIKIENTNGTEPVVIQFGELDKVVLFCDTKIQFNEGEFGGIPKIDYLFERMQAQETKLNDLIEKYNTHIHPIDGAVPLAPPTLPTSSPTISLETALTPLTIKSELENHSVTHGKSPNDTLTTE